MAVDVAIWALLIAGGLAVAEVSLVPERAVTGAEVNGAEVNGAEVDGAETDGTEVDDTEVELGTVATTVATPKKNNLDGVLQQAMSLLS